MNDDLVSTMQQLVADVMQVSENTVGPFSTPEDIDNWDSVQHLVLMLAVEERFGIIIDPETAAELRTPHRLARYLQDSLASA